jgi:hypothetical protein
VGWVGVTPPFFFSLFRVKAGGRPGDTNCFLDNNCFLNIYFSWVEISLHAEFEPLGFPRSGSFMVGENKTSFNEINGFLSLQLELRLELGLWLRLTKR